jgi:uncharacterized glyoxalase superfamily protein PhnB
MAEDPPATANPRWSVAPYFLVADVVATANFYRDKLGFQYRMFWGEPPCFTIVNRNSAYIMLSQQGTPGRMLPNSAGDPEGESWDAYIWIDNADALFEELTQKGVTIVAPICDQAYGCREFSIRDSNGYTIGFGQNLT